jgi:hypothetical protein
MRLEAPVWEFWGLFLNKTRTMIKLILAYLLHHANREYRSEEFYRIKNRILTKYGKVVGHDVQFIEGKKCRSCGGKGFHYRYGYGHYYNTADCYHCWGGWYKSPAWVLLQRIRFGRCIFHKPIERKLQSKNPYIQSDYMPEDLRLNLGPEVIQGYIDHKRTKFGKNARTILFLLYDWKGYWKRWYKSIGRGWRCSRYWWLRPRNWPNNIAHIIRYGRKAIPFMRKTKYQPPPSQPALDYQPEDLPF